MPATKTEKLPTVEQATAELLEAERHLEATRAAVVAGDSKVNAKTVADAQDAVEFATLRLELAQNADEHRTEQARVQRIAEIRERLLTGDIVEKGRKVVELEAKAQRALSALLDGAEDYHRATTATRQELLRLGDMPDDMDVSRSYGLTVAGANLPAGQASWVANVVRGVIYSVINPRIGAVNGPTLDLLKGTSVALHGGISDEKRTEAQMLAAALERLGSETDR